MGALAELQAGFLCEAGEVGAPGGDSFWWPGDVHPFRRDAGVQLKGAPVDRDVVFGAQPVDPNLADVAIRSDEVAEDSKDGAHRQYSKWDSTQGLHHEHRALLQ
jgi:hypothetical protein